MGHSSPTTTVVVLLFAGVVTTVPLWLFGAGARAVPLIVLGLLQYIAPTMQFVLGAAIYHEPFAVTQLIGFCIIWTALIVFTVEGMAQRRRLALATVTARESDRKPGRNRATEPPHKEQPMNFGITKTIPAKRGMAAVDALYEGDSPGEFEFHMAGTPSRLEPGHYVYTIFDNQIIGRLKITRLVPGAVNPKSGKPRTLIYVATPGERLPHPIPRRGHQGTRYYDGADWPAI